MLIIECKCSINLLNAFPLHFFFRLPSKPSFDRTKKPSEIDIPYDSKILRTVVIPVKVMTLFQAMAHSNTFKNIETCGVLTGKLVCIILFLLNPFLQSDILRIIMNIKFAQIHFFAITTMLYSLEREQFSFCI